MSATAIPETKTTGRQATACFAIINQRGLHARASHKFVQTLSRFDAEITVEKDGMSVGGTSIMGLMLLAAGPGSSITVSATGADAEEAVAALGSLIQSRFGEES
jgi:phosphocarrier protein